MTRPRPIHDFAAWFSSQSRMIRDLVVAAAIGIPLYVLAVWFDGFDRFLELAGEPQSDAIDWLVLLVVFLGIGAKIYSVRRVVDLHREVAARRKAEAEAYQLARHDVLTGLPNRRWFIEDYERWASNLPEGEACALFVMDLDNFKPINDVYGHRLGDEVLKVVANRLTRIAEGGSVARLGGDEFGIILRYRLDGDAPERLARRIVHELHRPIPLAALSLVVGVSVGVSTGCFTESATDSMTTLDGTRVDTALRRADMAMYWAKSEGRGRYRFFSRSMDEKLKQRVALESEIGSAIATGQIVPYYQPIVDLQSGTICGFEVLARWEHPKWGLLLPDSFITIAEDTGTIGEMADHLLEAAMRDAKNWPDDIIISLNFSPRQISDPGLALRIIGLLNKLSFPPRRLVIEITESTMVQRLEEAKHVLNALRAVGVRVALDDFGTGYSGLYHLRELELDAIKIDRSFIAQMLDKPAEARIVKAMLSLGRALGLETTAEGIENESARALLVKYGCDDGQGYLFGQPKPAAAVNEILRKETTRKAGKASTQPRWIA